MADNQPPSSQPQSRSILGLPIWAWGIGLGAFLIGVIYFFRQSQNPTGTSYAPTPSGASVPYPYPTGPSPTNQPPQPAGLGQVETQSIWGQGGGVWVFSAPGESPLVGIAPDKTKYDIAGPLVSGGEHTAGGITTAEWQPIKWGQSTAYIWGPEAVPATPSQTQMGAVMTSQTPPGVYGYG